MNWVDKLKKHWNLDNGWDLFWILMTFACTGSSVAYISRSSIKWFGWEDSSKVLIYGWKIFLFVIGYQILILIFGFIFGQFPFFWNYEKRILKRIFRINLD
jgi:hypothetical protein